MDKLKYETLRFLETTKNLFNKLRISGYIEVLVFVFVMVFKLMYFDEAIRGINHSSMDKIYMFIISLGTVLVLCSWTFLFSKRIRMFFLVILDILCSFVILADLYFFRYYNDFISVPTLEHTFLLNAVKGSILEIINFKDVVYVLDIFILLILIFTIAKFTNIKFKEKLTYRKRILRFVSVFCVGMLLITVRISALTQSEVYSWAFERYFFVSNMNILNFHAYDIYEYNLNQYKSEKPLQKMKKQQIKSWLKNHNKSNSGTNKFTGIAKDKNLIIVQVEALQEFVINRKINGQEITPNLNRLIDKSMYFNNYYYQTAQGNTSDAEFISNTSLFPLDKGAVFFENPTNEYKSIGESLKQRGYSTMAFHGYKSGFWNRGVMYPNIGIDKFYSMERLKIDKKIGLGLADKSMFNQCVNILDNTEQPFYSFIATLSSHHPFCYLSDYKGLKVGRYKDTYLGNYLKSINYVDSALGEFVKKLEKQGLLDESILVVYGDHFGIDKDHMDQLSKFLGTNVRHGLKWKKQQRVPMLIHFPNDKHSKTISKPSGQIDLFPTLANLYNISKDNLLGQDLLSENNNTIIFRNGSLINENIYYSSLNNKVYDIQTGEEKNILKYEDLIEKSQYKLNISDVIIHKDLFEEIE